MLASSNLGAIYGHQPGPSSANPRPPQPPPEPRMLACIPCRTKKQLCDRRKPSCSSCIKKGRDCSYTGRKPRITIDDLEDALQRLERKYATCLEAAEAEAQERALGPSSKSAKRASAPKNGSSASSSSSEDGGCRPFSGNPFWLSVPHCDLPYGGYHFDESFLGVTSAFAKIPSFKPKVASALSFLSAFSPFRRPPHPTRIFTPVIRIAPPIHPSNSSIGSGSCKKGNSQRIEVDKADSAPIKRRRVGSSLEYTVGGQSSEPITADNGTFSAPVLPYQGTYTASYNKIACGPTLHFYRSTWWDCLLCTYNTWSDASTPRLDVNVEISRDVYIFFKAAPLYLYFIHVPMFFDQFYHPGRRMDIQPALVLSILAYAKMLQANHGARGDESLREEERAWMQSVVVRDLAQAAFEASYNAGWVDLQLAQAAYILALFEMSPHRESSSYRMQSSTALLDSVIHAMNLTSIDAANPRVSTFTTDGRPVPNPAANRNLPPGYICGVPTPSTASIPPELASPSKAVESVVASSLWRHPLEDSSLHRHGSSSSSSSSWCRTTCPCDKLSLSSTPEMMVSTPSWKFTPKWAKDGTQGVIQREEARRLVWNSVIMVGCHANARRAVGLSQLDLHINKPENFAVLFPGEDVCSSSPYGHMLEKKNSAQWRASNASLGPSNSSDSDSDEDVYMEDMDEDTLMRDVDDDDFATRVWMETVVIENALDVHTCLSERSMMFQVQQVEVFRDGTLTNVAVIPLSRIRMEIAGGFRRAQNGRNGSELDRDSAIKWVRRAEYWSTAILAIIYEEGNRPGRKLVVERPFVVYLCVGALFQSLDIWKLDRTLSLAAEVALKLQKAIAFYQQFWPCTELQRWMERAEGDLAEAARAV
ncbi:hypothetical protein FRB98_007719 [Tulasnella sp. 332]|nr:hypothetical protein FRB98_007719 [Tulasnella sp. 332]